MRPMRILALMVPMAVAELRGASNFAALQDLIWNSRKAGDRSYWYVAIPSRYEKDVRPDDFPDGVKVIFIENECLDYYTEIAHTNSKIVKMFNQTWGEFPVDAVWTERTVAGITWQRLLSRQADKKPIPTTICEPEVEDARLINQETDAMLRAVSAVSCKYVVLNPDQVRLAVKRYGKFLSGSMIRRLRESCIVLPMGMDLSVIDGVLKRNPEKFEDFTILYGGRVAAIKRVDKVVGVMDGIFATGRSVKNLITTQTRGSKILSDVMDSAESVEFRIGVGREEFYETAARSHVFLCASGEEGEAIGFWEGLYLTGVGAFADVPWVRGLMPPDWPYLWRDIPEGVALLRAIYEDYEKAQEWTEKIREHVKNALNAYVQSSKHLEVIAQGVDEWRGPTEKSQIYQALREVSDEFKKQDGPVTWGVWKAVVNKAISVSPFRGRIRNDMPGRYDYVRMFLNFGWEDTYEEEYPVFVQSME